MTVRKTTEVEIGKGSVMEASENEVYATAAHTTEAFAEETSATVSVLLRWLGFYLINFKFEQAEDYGKETTEACASNMRGKECFGGFEIRVAAIEAPHDEGSRKDGFASVHKQEKRPY